MLLVGLAPGGAGLPGISEVRAKDEDVSRSAQREGSLTKS